MKPRKNITQDQLANALEKHLLDEPSDWGWINPEDDEYEIPHSCNRSCADDIFERLATNPTENSEWAATFFSNTP